MGLLREIALVILGISMLTFLVLFGRIPAFRRTPIGYAYRFVWIHTPKFFSALDSILCGGRFKRYSTQSGQYLFHSNHPIILIFFLILLVCGEILFIPAAWHKIGSFHHYIIPIVALQPYIFLYLSAVTKSSITPENHASNMQLYPYDHIIFHPGNMCRTCGFLKPARSKHCGLCNTCVARHDHHCIWLRNCVGRNNYSYFLALLLSTSILLGYGAFLGYTILSNILQIMLIPELSPSSTSKHWSQGLSWGTYLEVWTWVVADNLRIGAVSLLATLTAPLSGAMLFYHIYLIWAGVTTNESDKWSDWRDDVANGIAFKARSNQIYRIPYQDDYTVEPKVSWPKPNEETMAFTDGSPPKKGFRLTPDRFKVLQPDDPNADDDPRWVKVLSMREIVNIYDCGFRSNLLDSLNMITPSLRKRSEIRA